VVSDEFFTEGQKNDLRSFCLQEGMVALDIAIVRHGPILWEFQAYGDCRRRKIFF